jgi:tRNA A-37 threonylcarbamoyl transferase component Bud32
MSTGEPGNPVPMIRSPGATLGSRYTLQHKIGSGGYSEVWQAQDAVLDRPVAIKLLHPEYAESGEALQRFRTEAQLAGRLSDANVARVYDFCDTGWPGPPFLVMELIDGPTLADVLRGGPLGPARTMDILSQAASGLNAAHSAGLVHRDIKPSNIMMAPGNVVKIMDFGLSHSLASAPITRTGMVAGTPSFMAPERSSGARATPASDLYSLGVVGYECLAGSPPFSGTPLEVALAHRFGVFPPLPAPTPAPVAELIARLTARDPGDRPDDARLVARQAGHLRDAIGAGAASPGAPPDIGAAADYEPGPGRESAPGYYPAPLMTGDALPAQHTLIVAVPPDETGPPLAPARRRRPAAIGWLIAAVAGVAVVITIVAIALANGSAPSSAPSHQPQTQAVHTVDVSRAALLGEPVTQAARQLRSEGFRVDVLWTAAPAQTPATVLGVRPAGLRPAGSLITLVAAFRPDHGHHHGHGHGNGNGNQGDGND